MLRLFSRRLRRPTEEEADLRDVGRCNGVRCADDRDGDREGDPFEGEGDFEGDLEGDFEGDLEGDRWGDTETDRPRDRDREIGVREPFGVLEKDGVRRPEERLRDPCRRGDAEDESCPSSIPSPEPEWVFSPSCPSVVVVALLIL